MLGRISSRVDSRGSVLPPSLNDSPLDFLELKMTEFEYICLKNCKGGGKIGLEIQRILPKQRKVLRIELLS